MRVAAAFQMMEYKKLKRFVLAQILSGDMHAGNSSGRRIYRHDFTCAFRRSAIGPQRTKLFRRRIRVRRFDSGSPNLYDSVEHEIGYLLIKRPRSRRKPFENVNLFSDQLKAIAGAMSRWFQCSENLFYRFALCSRNPGLRGRPDFQVENRPPFFLSLGERNVLTISKPADFLF